MKPLPTPQVPGDAPWERSDNAFRIIITVPKEAFVKDGARRKRARAGKLSQKTSAHGQSSVRTLTETLPIAQGARRLSLSALVRIVPGS